MKHQIAMQELNDAGVDFKSTSGDHEFSAKYRVYYEDTDAGGVMYYANYLKFFERARTDFLRSKDIIQSDLLQKNIAFVVRSCDIDYFSPARLDDFVEVSVVIAKISAASIDISQKMTCQNRVLAKLKSEIVCVDSVSFKPRRILESILKLI